MGGLIKNPFEVNDGIDLFMKKVESTAIDVFRELVWLVFTEILEQTPQWSGKAVANWNIGVGAPDYSWDDHVGDKVDLWATNAKQKGDREWIEYAKFRNADKLRQISRRDRVYITNSVHGDDDGGRAGSLMYLEALQNPGYWAQKLREANKPYEVAADTMMRVLTEYRAGRKTIGLSLVRAGGASVGRYT